MSYTDCCEESEGITIPAGSDGSNGEYGGYSSNFLWSTATGSTPGSTFVRFNNSTYSSVTQIFISETNGDSISVADWLDSFVNSSAFGMIKIFKESDSTKFWFGRVTAHVDNGTDRTLTVTYVDHNGTFAANDSVIVNYTMNGATGAAGSNGTNGTDGIDGIGLLASHVTLGFTSAGYPVYTALGTSGTIAAGTLDSNGDKIRITQLFTKQATADNFYTRLQITNNAATNDVYSVQVPSQMVGGTIISEIIRVDATTCILNVYANWINGIATLVPGYAVMNRALPIVFADTIVLSAQYATNGAGTITHQHLAVENLTIN